MIKLEVTESQTSEWREYADGLGLTMEDMVRMAVQNFIATDKLGVRSAKLANMEQQIRMRELAKRAAKQNEKSAEDSPKQNKTEPTKSTSPAEPEEELPFSDSPMSAMDLMRGENNHE